MELYPVIMCGGSGTRLWPLSRPERPKQFIPLVGLRSTFQQTALRLSRLPGVVRPVIIAGSAHAHWIAEQLEALDLAADVLLEPTPRDSGPAVAAAAAWIARQSPAGIAVIVASDHHIPDDDAFLAAVEAAAGAAAQGSIVTLGLKPTEPSSAYGYINAGALIEGDKAVCRVAAFVEKPDEPTAKGYVESGYLWNSGNFIASAKTLIDEFGAYSPAILKSVQLSLDEATTRDGAHLLGEVFSEAPKISFDYAVMEKTERAAVLPVSFPWSDLGAWDAVWRVSPQNEAGNSGSARTLFIDAKNCLVRTPGALDVALIGVKDLAVIADDKGLLICPLDQSQSVKAAATYFGSLSSAAVANSISLSAHAERYERWLRASALPLWWTVGADHVRGGFHDLVDQDGRAALGPRRARVQARQAFVYATAAALGFEGPWRQAALHGLDYFVSRYQRPDGLYRTTIGDDGEVLDDRPFLYDQAFALMSQAVVFRIAPDRDDLPERALTHLAAIKRHMAHPGGGFREAGDHPFQANAHMHLLEAALAWIETDGGDVWRELATDIVSLALRAFIDPDSGALREFFNADWSPAPGEEGRLLEPGHQFEWAWLMQRWALMTNSQAAHEAAKGLFAAGLKGVDPKRSVAIDELNDDFSTRSARARLWPQTEYIKAALILAKDAPAESVESLLGRAAQGAEGLWRYLETPIPGLWRDKLSPNNQFVSEPAPASSLYHIVGAIVALTDWRRGG